MKSIRSAGLLFSILTLAGCNKLESVPQTPPPETSPTVANDASLRPLYLMETGAPVAAGTAFVVQDKAGKRYMLTAAHVLDDPARWQQTKSAALRVMGGPVVGQVENRPSYVGKPFTEAGPAFDLVIWPLAEGAKAVPLKLAAADPKKNEWLWVIGQEANSSGPQKLYRCQVSGAESGGFVLKQLDHFEMKGFSGGPVVNAQGDVVGSLLGGRSGDEPIISGVSGIRARLAEAKIEIP
jgi:Trypsin-like peptidase domain